MKYCKLFLLIVLVRAAAQNGYCQNTSINEMISNLDSLYIIDGGFEKEELINITDSRLSSISGKFCYPTSYHFQSNSRDVINSFGSVIELNKTNEVMFCGFNYSLTGYRNGVSEFNGEYNSECNYLQIDKAKFYSSNLLTNTAIDLFDQHTNQSCFYVSQETRSKHLDSLSTFNNSVEFQLIDELSIIGCIIIGKNR